MATDDTLELRLHEHIRVLGVLPSRGAGALKKFVATSGGAVAVHTWSLTQILEPSFRPLRPPMATPLLRD